MQVWLLHILQCPVCKEFPLNVAIEEQTTLEEAIPPFYHYPCPLHNKIECDECLKIDISKGVISCICGQKFPIFNHIPYFEYEISDELSRKTANIYNYLWNKVPHSKLYGRTVEQDLETFRVKTGKDETSLGGKIVLDAGCGAGGIVSQFAARGINAVGCDLSVPGNLISQEMEPKFNFVQCNILELPFRGGIFDYIYSIGVLHHIKLIEKAIQELNRIMSETGELSIWVYDYDNTRYAKFDNLLRSITVELPAGVIKLISYFLAPGYSLIREFQGAKARHIKLVDRPHIIFDWLKTPYRKFYTQQGFESLLMDNGLRVTYVSDHSIGITCRKMDVD